MEAVIQHNKKQSFFDQVLTSEHDSEVFQALKSELSRQQNQIELIASENIASPAVLAAQGSVMTNKYAEGYPGKRYYDGCHFVDQVETLAIERACQLFGCEYANVQPHSGSQANQAVFLALIKPGDTVLGMDLSAGGHLTHGARPNQSGKWFNVVSYNVREDNYLIDYDQVEALAKEHQPKLIIAGASAYPRHIDFKRFREIAESVGAYLLADVAHYSGLIATGDYPSPFPHAHVVTTTTHKTLRGPRGGMILTNDEALAKKFNFAVFPGLQGGPLMHVIAAKAIAFKEALAPEFKDYSHAVLKNAQVMAQTLVDHGVDVITGGTDCHMALVDLRSIGVTGKDASTLLDDIGITCNKNGVPFDDASPMVTSGIRLGSPAATTRGFGENEFMDVAKIIAETLHALAKAQKNGQETIDDSVVAAMRQRVQSLCDQFPIYPSLLKE